MMSTLWLLLSACALCRAAAQQGNYLPASNYTNNAVRYQYPPTQYPPTYHSSYPPGQQPGYQTQYVRSVDQDQLLRVQQQRPAPAQQVYQSQQPAAGPPQQGYQSQQPSAGSSQSGYQSQQPSAGSSQSGYQSQQPSAGSSQSGYQSQQPSAGSSQSGYQSQQPSAGSSQSGYQSQQPAAGQGYQSQQPAAGPSQQVYQQQAMQQPGAAQTYAAQPVQQGAQPVAQPVAMMVPQPGPLTYEEWTRYVDTIISKGVLQLSLSLAAAVEREGDLSGQSANVVFSPVNVASALALVLAGSNGTTFNEIAKVLGIATGVNVLENRERVHKEFGRFLSQLETASTLVSRTDAPGAMGGNHVVFANGLFVQKDFAVQPHFEEIAKSYRSQVIHVEFAREPSRTKERINSWFSEHTMGRIHSVLAEAPPTDTRLMIASALFFNGAWEAPFPTEATMTRAFYGASANGSVEAFAVRMMTNNMDLPLSVDRALGCRLLELPYKGRDVSMYMVLPDAQGLGALRDLEHKLTPEIMEGLIAGRKVAPVIYSVPRMKLERSISLRTALETLGVHSLFDAQLADLTHLSQTVVQPVEKPMVAAVPASSVAARPPASTTPTPRPSSTTATPTPTTTTGRAKPSRPPLVENIIPPESEYYFASRMSDLAKLGNDTFVARLYADDVLHKVEVEVTETGTVASAATAITISRDGSNHVMRFNRPFLFFIRHNPTGLVLFYGSVVRPMPEWIVPGVDVSKLPPARPASGNRQPPSSSGRRPPGRQRAQPPPAGAPPPTPTGGSPGMAG